MKVENFMMGLVILIFCLGLSVIIPDVLTIAGPQEELFRLGFLALGIFSFILSLVVE